MKSFISLITLSFIITTISYSQNITYLDVEPFLNSYNRGNDKTYLTIISSSADTFLDIMNDYMKYNNMPDLVLYLEDDNIEYLGTKVSKYFDNNPERKKEYFFLPVMEMMLQNTEINPSKKPVHQYYNGARLFKLWIEFKKNNYSYMNSDKARDYIMYVSIASSVYIYNYKNMSSMSNTVEIPKNISPSLVPMLVGVFLEENQGLLDKNAAELIRLSLVKAFPLK
jgi:hypothetical protein